MIGFILGALFGLGSLTVARELNHSVQGFFERPRIYAGITVTAEHTAFAVVGSIIGGIAGTAFGVDIAATTVLVVGGFVGGVIFFQELQKSAAKDLDLRRSLLVPAFVDALALTISTGMPVRAALLEVLSTADVEVRDLWNYVEKNPDVPLVTAIGEAAATCSNVAHERVMHSIIVATERGTPLTEVLQALAAEQRAEGRRTLLEIAAKKDVVMMLPVVFGILPSITAIALYPALSSLSTLN